jgi:hypothetical protein
VASLEATFSIVRAAAACRVARDQAGQRVGLVHQPAGAVFGLQFGQAVGALDGQVQQLGLERLGEEVVGTQGHGAQRVGLVVLAGEHDDLDVGSRSSICSSSLKPSDTESGSGGRPRSMVTTAGWWRRTCTSALSRSLAVTTRSGPATT